MAARVWLGQCVCVTRAPLVHFILVPATSRVMFSNSWHRPKGCTMHPIIFKASNITGIENLLISYHLKCKGTFQAFTLHGHERFHFLRLHRRVYCMAVYGTVDYYIVKCCILAGFSSCMIFYTALKVFLE